MESRSLGPPPRPSPDGPFLPPPILRISLHRQSQRRRLNSSAHDREPRPAPGLVPFSMSSSLPPAPVEKDWPAARKLLGSKGSFSSSTSRQSAKACRQFHPHLDLDARLSFSTPELLRVIYDNILIMDRGNQCRLVQRIPKVCFSLSWKSPEPPSPNSSRCAPH